MAGNPHTPAAAVRQFFLDRQSQTIGNIGGGPDAPVPVPANIPQPNAPVSIEIQRTMSNALFNTFTFADQFTLPYNPRRVYLLVQNNGAAILYLNFQGIAPPFTTGLQIIVGGNYEPFMPPINAISGSGSAGFVSEGLLP